MTMIAGRERGFTSCRRTHSMRKWSVLTIAAMIAALFGPAVAPVAHAQAPPVGAGFTLTGGDLRFILRQIQIAEAHAAGGQLFGPGPDQVNELRFPFGLRTVDGSYNHLQPGTETFGSADQVFPRLTTPQFRQAESHTFDPDGPGPVQAGDASSYEQKRGVVNDSQPRVISNLIVNQTASNPIAVQVAGDLDPGFATNPLGTVEILNVAPDAGLSASFNGMFTFFGQFFDHGLDLVNKGGGTVFIPLKSDDSLFVSGAQTNFMALTRATNRPGPDGIAGDDPATPADESADDIHEANNQTTPFVDQNQTYTSHPSHQVFLREYVMANGVPVATGRMIDGGGSVNGVAVKNIGNWGEVKAQAAALLGIGLVDSDVLNVPLIAADPYGRFLRGPNGFPMVMMTDNTMVEGNPNSPISTFGAKRTNHAFLDDIAHAANPSNPGYDAQLLAAHFCTGDGRGNENIALSAVHSVFHAEHNRLRGYIDGLIHTPGVLTAAEIAQWEAAAPEPPAGSGWTYGERLFQASRFVTEMQYQHLVFEEFARKVAPSINPFIGDGINFVSNLNPAISAEFAHQVYRLGHSMLLENIARTNADGSNNDIPLLDGFLNPFAFNDGGSAGPLTAAQAAGSVFQGGTRQIGSEIDEFVTEAVRSRLLGLPLDLAVLNLARGRSEGIPPLNSVRRQLFAASSDPAMAPYESWFDFSFAMRNPESVVNFIAAYGSSPLLDAQPTVAGKREKAALLAGDDDFMFGDPTATGLEKVDLWMGGLAEKPNPFGGLLGTTFNFIFEKQLENLQNADRFYYLERLDGLNLLSQLEGNSFSEVISRNTTLTGAPADIFSRPAFIFDLSKQNATGPIVDDLATPDVDERFELHRLPNGAIRYGGPEHVVWVGRDDAIGDRVISSEGDDTLRGNGGNDVLEGGSGNDQHLGGAGDDILLDTFGDDVMKGGPGNDAINGGSGPFDLLQGNDGNDFIVGGNDLSEVFGGTGDDIIYMGEGLSESIGGTGDDWMEGTVSPASIAIGDDNNQFQDDPNGGNDILLAGPGDMDFDSEGGDDIMVGSVLPTHRFEGMLGFDWVTYRGDPIGVDADMSIRVVLPPNLNELRDRFDLAEALSGWNGDDALRGDDRLADDIGVGHVLTPAGIDRIAGLRAMLVALVGNAAAQPGFTFASGNIIMGGAGSDLIEGRAGDDLIDGDAWLNVQLRAPNPATPDPSDVQLVDTLHALKADVFAGRINPGQITMVRSIVTSGSNGIDTAVFSGNRAEYTISSNGGTVTVAHTAPVLADDGTDRLRNIERLQFADVTISTGNNAPTGAPVLTQPLPQEAEQLSVQNGTLADADGLPPNNQIAVQWQDAAPGSGFANIPGATARQFTPTQAQVGRLLRAILSYTDNGGHAESVASAPTGVVGDVFAGTPQNDVFEGTAGRDLAEGGLGNDTLNTGDADDVARGQEGNDTLNTGAGNDVATGGAGDDVINAGDGDDSIRIGAGADGGFDTVNGGNGIDEIRALAVGTTIGLTALTAVETITANGLADVQIQGSGAANTFNFAGVTLVGIEEILGGAGDDVITGSAAADTIDGEGGADVISGGAGADVIRGGAGPDNLSGGGAADDIQGGGDNDVLHGNNGNDSLSGGAGNDDIEGGAGDDAIDVGATIGTDIIRFSGDFGTDTITGFGATASPTVGQDVIDLSAYGITAGGASFGTFVNKTQQGANTRLIVTNPATGLVVGTIIIVGVQQNTITGGGGDFLLAP